MFKHRRCFFCTIGTQLKKLRKRGKSTASQCAALLQATAALNLAPPPRASFAPPPPPPPPPVLLPPPAPAASTRAASADLEERLFGSEEAAIASGLASRYEEARNWLVGCQEDAAREAVEGRAEGDEDPWAGYDHENTERVELLYKQQLRRLAAAFPELELNVAEQLMGMHANEHNSKTCDCGHGKLARWPFMLQLNDHGWCECENSGYWTICDRGEWVEAGAPGYAY